MKTMKKLQVAAAAASLFAVAGVANAAFVNSTGAVVAQETIWPNASPGNYSNGATLNAGSAVTAAQVALGRVTKVRAPTFTYSYEGGLTAGANSEQFFQIQGTLGGGAEWAFPAAANYAADTLVASFDNTQLDLISRTISANLRGVGNVGRRVAVLGPTDAAANANQPVFFIELLQVKQGRGVVITSPADIDTNPQTVTYYFRIRNGTGSQITLSAVDLTINGGKTAAGAPTDYVTGSAQNDAATTPANSLFASIGNLQSLIGRADGDVSCRPDVDGRISLQVLSGEGVTATIGPEPNNTAIGGNSSTTILNYLSARRATDLIVAKGADRNIAVTNSFQTNLGATPINGVGGTGGGRLTFKPSVPGTVTNNFGSGTNGLFTVGPVGDGNAVLDGVGTFPVRSGQSADIRTAGLGTLRFANRTAAYLDRLIDLDFYGFKAEAGAGHLSTGYNSLGFTNGDFTTVADPGGPQFGAPANVFGGVDLSATTTLVITFTSKPNFGWRAAGGTLTLLKGAAPTDAVALAANGTLVEVPAGSGNYVWTFSRADLDALSGASDTLFGDWSIAYRVDGNANIPAAAFTNVQATLNKDDATEQNLLSCPSTLANVFGGVKVDVRNFQGNIAGEWTGVTRIINNSETDSATVEGQFIHQNTGAYGRWAVLAGIGGIAPHNLAPIPPRGVAYWFNGDIEAQINGANGRNSTAPGANNAAPAAGTNPRLRISADVSTIRVQSYIFNVRSGALTEASGSQGADFVNIESSNRDHIDQDAQTDIQK